MKFPERLEQAGGAALTDTVGTSFKQGINVEQYGTRFKGFTDISGTLMTRDYKGLGKQRQTVIKEQHIEKIVCKEHPNERR